MKQLRLIKKWLMLLTVMLLSVLCGSFAVTAAGTGSPVRTAQSIAAPAAAAVNYNRIGQVLKTNRLFDECFFDERAMIEEATIALLNRAVDTDAGYKVIEFSLIQDYCRGLYGREVDAGVVQYDDMPAPAGYITVLPRCYYDYTHYDISANVLPDGRIEVRSVMLADCGEIIRYCVITTLRPDMSSPFGYTVLAANIETE